MKQTNVTSLAVGESLVLNVTEVLDECYPAYDRRDDSAELCRQDDQGIHLKHTVAVGSLRMLSVQVDTRASPRLPAALAKRNDIFTCYYNATVTALRFLYLKALKRDWKIERSLELIEGGDLRSLSPRPGEPEYFYDSRPTERLQSAEELPRLARELTAEHIYYYGDERWTHQKMRTLTLLG